MAAERSDTNEGPYLEDEGIPHLHDLATDEEVMPPLDIPQGIDQHGTTAVEQREGEPLGRRLAAEQPDVDVTSSLSEARSPGRLVEEEAELGQRDRTKEMIGRAAEDDREGLSAEEQAVTVIDENP
jgi:hypothetical protein